jgi:endonuclease IV
MKKDRIFISTQARIRDIESLIQYCLNSGVGIELSSGCDMPLTTFFNVISHRTLEYRFHNYFPIPQVPFVIDVASENKENRQVSLNFIKRNLIVSQKLGLQYYSFHAGFTTSPLPRELGGSFDRKPLSEQSVVESRERFYQSIEELIQFSEDIGVGLVIENNVVGPENFLNGYSVAHLSSHQEILQFFSEFSSERIGLMLDTAHYFISENSQESICFEPDKVKFLAPYTKVVHHSETKNMRDCNSALDQSYWFSKYVGDFRHCDHVLELRNVSDNLLNESINVLERALY